VKYVPIAAIMLVVGLVLGGLPPRAELREVRQELADAVAQDCSGQVGRDLARLLGQGSRPVAPRTPQEEALDRPDEIAAAHPDAVAEAERIDAELEAAEAELAEELEDMTAPDEQELELARTALDLRRAQSRAALVEDTDPSDEQLEAIDQAYADMNDVLLELSDELVEMIASGEAPDRRDSMEFAADALDALLAAEQSVEGLLDADQLEGLSDDVLNSFNYIDPDIVDALEGLEQDAP
jgi:hypothetical protein